MATREAKTAKATAVSIASCEQSLISKLKLTLTYLKASVGHDCLSNLALLSVEKKRWIKIEFDTTIQWRIQRRGAPVATGPMIFSCNDEYLLLLSLRVLL